MEKHFGDIVVDKLKERRDVVRATLKQRFKRTQPFRMEKISDEEMLALYNSTTPEQMVDMINQYGAKSVNDYIGEMESLKERRSQNA